jgi:choline dehydrogenase-like flavoprotein
LRDRASALGAREQAVLRAFAASLLPGSRELPAAEVDGGVPVVEPIATLLAKAPPYTGRTVRAAIRLFEWTSFPRRFTHLSPARRAAHLARIEGWRRGWRRELFLLLKTLCAFGYTREPGVQRTVGVRSSCAVAGHGNPGPGPIARLERAAMKAPEGSERCDVVVIGSGAGGAAAARELSERGLSVIVVEEGDYHDSTSYSNDPVEALPMLYRDSGMTFCQGRPPIALPLGRCVGGTTVVNSGTCFRAPPPVLARWRDDHGIGWATELEREFEAVERDLLVKPVDADTAGRNAELCRIGADAIGASNGPIARNAGDVVCCGTCPSGCELDAKQATHVSELPRAVMAGCLVRAGARVVEVKLRGGNASGVVCETESGARYEVEARAVVVAGGAIGTPELLLSQGIADSSGQLGRNLRIHPACWVGARFDEEVRGWDGVMQSWYVDEWNELGLFLEATFTPFVFGAHWLPGAGAAFEEQIARYDRIAVLGVHLSDRSSQGRVRVRRRNGASTATRGRISYKLTQEDAQVLRYGIARAADILLAAGAQEVYPQLAGVPAIKRGERGESIERGRVRPKDLRLEAFHPMGTARMGVDGHSSVVSPTGEAHDVPGLYIVDASIFPTSLRVNPMITIMACSRRIARGLAERLL